MPISLQVVIRQRWSVRRAEYEVRMHRLGGHQLQMQKSATTNALEKDIAKHLGCAVVINEQSGTLSIDYCKDLDVLDGVLHRLGYPKN